MGLALVNYSDKRVSKLTKIPAGCFVKMIRNMRFVVFNVHSSLMWSKIRSTQIEF